MPTSISVRQLPWSEITQPKTLIVNIFGKWSQFDKAVLCTANFTFFGSSWAYPFLHSPTRTGCGYSIFTALGATSLCSFNSVLFCFFVTIEVELLIMFLLAISMCLFLKIEFLLLSYSSNILNILAGKRLGIIRVPTFSLTLCSWFSFANGDFPSSNTTHVLVTFFSNFTSSGFYIS